MNKRFSIFFSFTFFYYFNMPLLCLFCFGQKALNFYKITNNVSLIKFIDDVKTKLTIGQQKFKGKGST